MTNKKDKILFWLENYSIHFGIAKTLQEKHDCDLFALISCSPKQKSFFNDQKLIKFKNKWFTRDYVNLTNYKCDIKNLQQLENSLNISLSKIIYGDRLFYKFNKYYSFTDEEIFSIIEQEFNFYNDILDEIHPDYVIMRAPEFQDIELFYEICKAKKIPVLILSSMKFGSRWIISSTPYPSIQFDQSDNEIKIKNFDVLLKEIQSYRKIFASFLQQAQSKNTQKLKSAKSLFSIFNSSNINSYHDVGKTPLKILFKQISFLLLSSYRKFFLNRNAKISIPLNQPFAYFPLHAEPDVAISRIGDFYSDQISVIKNITQSLPVEMNLLVKEHPSMQLFGWRNLKYYKEIIQMPKVILIHPFISSEELIKNSSLVITIAGTTALEAVLSQKPCIVFSDLNCSNLSSVFKINELKELPDIIIKCLNSKVDLIELNHFFNKIEKSTFLCNVENLNTLSSNIFGVGGNLNMNEISESQMKLFIEDYRSDFDILATEHIKQIKSLKQNYETFD